MIQFHHDAQRRGLLEQTDGIFLRTTAPKNTSRFGQPRSSLDAFEQCSMRRLGIADTARGRDGWREVIHKVRLRANSQVGAERIVIFAASPASPSKFSGVGTGELPRTPACAN